MDKKVVSLKSGKGICAQKTKAKPKAISYRLKCKRTANGLSHYVMYGDVAEKEALL